MRTSLAPLTDRESAEYLDRRPPRPIPARRGQPPIQHSRGIMRRLKHLATGALLAVARAGCRHVDAHDVQAAVFDDEHA